MLDHIRQCTYVIENEKALQKLKSDLRGLLLDIQSVIPTAHGLTVEGGEAPKKRRAPNPDTRRTCYAALPLRPPKNKFKGRVGQRASIGRNTYKVKLNVQGKRCQAKTPPDARPSEGSHERPKRTTCRAPEPDEPSAVHAGTSDEEECSPASRPRETPQEPPKRRTCQAPETDEPSAVEHSDDDIEITDVRIAEVPKRKKRSIDDEELSLIVNGRCLTDTSINCAQNLLHSQFPLCEGLEDTTLGPFLQFSVQSSEFVQVLHSGSMHWVCVSNIGCQCAEVNYFDSLFSGQWRPFIKRQIAALLNERGPEITVNVQAVEQQANSVDCGPYSLAFATSLLSGQDPASISYDEDMLRQHLIGCFAAGIMSPFPQRQSNRRRCRRAPKRTLVFDVYCLCRMPWDEGDEANPDLRMAQCDKCDRWVHKKCANIPKEVFGTHTCYWACPICLP